MNKPLAGKKFAILAANGFEEVQFVALQKELLALGATTRIVSNGQGLVNGWTATGWGMNFPVDAQLTDAMAADFDGCIVPDGERSTMKLRETAHTKRLLNHFIEADKPVIAVGEGAALLALTRCMEGRTVAAPAAHHEALAAAGATVVEDVLAADGALLTASEAVEAADLVAAATQILLGSEDLQEAA